MHDDMTGMKSGRIVYWGILNYYDFLLEQVPVFVYSWGTWFLYDENLRWMAHSIMVVKHSPIRENDFVLFDCPITFVCMTKQMISWFHIHHSFE